MKPTFLAALLLVLAPNSYAQKWFDCPLGMTVPGNTVRGIGDADSSGSVDVLEYVSSSALRVRYNDGSGMFVPGPDLATSTTSVLWPGLVDVTGDGLADILLGSNNELSILPGLAGGGFGPQSPVTAIPGHFDHATGDFDGDLVVDVVLADAVPGATDLLVYSWNGAGFTLVNTLTTQDVESILAFDRDGDGIDDLLVNRTIIANAGARLEPYTGVSGGGFVAESAIDESLVWDPAVSVGDVDHDGDLDLLWSFRPPPDFDFRSVRVLRNDGSGIYTADPAQELPQYIYRDSIETGALRFVDWDGDGDEDLFGVVGATSSGSVIVTENLGGEIFSTESITPHRWEPVDTADFDGDGRGDLVGDGALLFSNGRFESSPFVVLRSGEILDLDDDGDLDGIGEDGSLVINRGDGSAEYPGQPFDRLDVVSSPASWIYNELVSAGDFDGDARPDFLMTVVDGGLLNYPIVDLRLFRGRAVGGFVDDGSSAGAPFKPSSVRPWPTVDLDLDGDLDVLVGDGYRENDGTGFFTFVTAWASTEATDAADPDEDGDIDVLGWHLSTMPINVSQVLLRNDGTTSFTEETYGEWGASAQFQDVDDDGDLDFAWTSSSTGLQIAVNDGGAFSVAIVATGLGLDSRNIFADDVDRDGHTDLITTGLSSHLEVFRRTGPTLAYEPPVRFYVDDPQSSSQVVPSRHAVDVDGDGDLDFVGQNGAIGLRTNAPENGLLRQYGQGVPGTGGATAVLGARGPLVPGSPTAEVRVRRARGGALVFLFMGTEEASLPIAGLTALVDQVYAVRRYTLGGPLLAPGEGELTLPLQIDASLVGTRIFLQGLILDSYGQKVPSRGGGPALATKGFVTTNGLELVFGSP